VSDATRMIETALRRADFLISDSAFIRDQIVSRLGWPQDRIRAIHLGCSGSFQPCNAQVAQPVLSRFGLTYGSYALCVATIEPRKNISTLVHAYAALPERLRNRYPLVLAGARGWQSGNIHKLIELHSRNGWLRYLGYVPESELPSLFAGARGFIYPSLYEGFGLPVVEAMASGLPIVTSRTSSLPEITQSAALLVNPEDVDELIAAISKMLEDRDWRTDAVAKSLQAAGRYSWSETVAQTVETYRAALCA
jgi:glycosyltransferase involved in cell wall biosynthesis